MRELDVYQLSIFVHVLSAIVWVGGMLFLALVAVPATRHLPPAERGALVGALGVRFRPIGWLCIGVLVATGLVNAAYRGVTLASLMDGRLFSSQLGWLLAIKVTLVAVMIALSAIHDFAVGPASVRAATATDAATAALRARLRRQASWLARVTTLLALVVVALGVLLGRGLPW
ncbi:MAG: DUF4149 domain-containing protein [Chloroflexi bacterium]|nr:DUF4149 domain-containing protein [Chloroflexota bacterium]